MKKFYFDPKVMEREAIGGRPYPRTLTTEAHALLAIAERLEAIYEEMVEAKLDRRGRV